MGTYINDRGSDTACADNSSATWAGGSALGGPIKRDSALPACARRRKRPTLSTVAVNTPNECRHQRRIFLSITKHGCLRQNRAKPTTLGLSSKSVFDLNFFRYFQCFGRGGNNKLSFRAKNKSAGTLIRNHEIKHFADSHDEPLQRGQEETRYSTECLRDFVGLP